MNLPLLIASFLVALSSAGSNAVDSSITTTVCLQSIAFHPGPFISLAEIQYDSVTLTAEISTFDAPELSYESNFIRIGICDTVKQLWKSSTSITSADSFSKAYAPIIVLSLDTHGDIIGVTSKSVKVDAGYTRDFGPKVKVTKMTKGKEPELNRPIMVSKEETEEGELPEKTMLQKYWWVAAGVMVLLLATGGGDK